MRPSYLYTLDDLKFVINSKEFITFYNDHKELDPLASLVTYLHYLEIKVRDGKK